jgi:hypothetical protein
MSQINSMFSHHIAQVAMAELVGDVSAHAENDH